MTTDSTEQETEPEGTDEPGDNADSREGADITTEPSAPAREAAKYRRRLRDTEVERDGLAVRVAGYQRREAERLAGASLSRGDDVWLAGAGVADVLDDGGEVDADLVAEAARAVLDGRPQLGATFGRGVRPNPQQGMASTAKPKPGWQQVLKGR